MPAFLIDPPGGHAYGFPKMFEGDIETLDFVTWLRQHGYPEADIELFSGNVPCRIISLTKDHATAAFTGHKEWQEQ